MSARKPHRPPGRGADWLESVPDALAAWARHNGCDGDAVLDHPPGPLSTLSYKGCDADVRLVRVDGLVHAWARGEIDATAAAVGVLQGATTAGTRALTTCVKSWQTPWRAMTFA